ELSQLLRGLGEYKQGGGGDRGRLLALWTGAPWDYSRVSGETDIRIAKPTVVICGGLQPTYLNLLGREEDGLRPRWFLHLSGLPGPRQGRGQPPRAWDVLVRKLLDRRQEKRTWRL